MTAGKFALHMNRLDSKYKLNQHLSLI